MKMPQGALRSAVILGAMMLLAMGTALVTLGDDRTASSEATVAAVPRLFTWHLPPGQTTTALVSRGAGSTVFAGNPETGIIRFLASVGDWVMIEMSASAREAVVEGKADAVAEGKTEVDHGERKLNLIWAVAAADEPEFELAMTPDSPFLRNHDQVIGVCLSLDQNRSVEQQLASLAALPPAELKGLRFLVVSDADGSADDEHSAKLLRAFAQWLSEIQPTRFSSPVSLPSDPQGLTQSIPAHLDLPAVFMGEDQCSAETLALLTGKRLESLSLKIKVGDHAALGKLPQLRHLQVAFSGKMEPAGRLLDGLALQSLQLQGPEQNLPQLAPQKDLLRLVAPAKSLAHLDPQVTFPKLRSLCTAGSALPWLPVGLEHLVFADDQGVTAELLRRIVQANPELRVIEFVRCNELNDLSALKGLARLEAVVLAKTVTTDLASLAAIQTLKLVADNEDRLPELRQRLPAGVEVIPVDGFCLGSGWLLLLLAVVVIGAVVVRRGRRRGTLPEISS